MSLASRPWNRVLQTVASLIVLLSIIGCTDSTKDSHGHDHDHDHAGEHDHDHEGAHDHEAPHGGSLVVLGSEVAHLEALVEAETSEVILYILSQHAEHPVQLPLEAVAVEYRAHGTESWKSGTLPAVTRATTGDAPGNASEFRGKLDGVTADSEIELRIPTIEVLGTTFEGTVIEIPGGAHE